MKPLFKPSFRLVLLAVFLVIFPLASAQCLIPESNQKISTDAVFCEGEYHVKNIGISGNGFVVQCNETRLIGEGQGSGINVMGSQDVTINGCQFSSYEVGIVVEDSTQVGIRENTFYNNKIGIAWLRSEVVEEDNKFIGSARQDTLEIEEEISTLKQAIFPLQDQKPTPSGILAQHITIRKPGASAEEIEDDVGRALSFFESSQELLDIQRTITENPDNSTTITLSIIPKQPLLNVSIYESIPKCMAEYVHQIVIGEQGYEVIADDPLLMWTFQSLSQEKKISYTIFKTVSKQCEGLLLALGIAFPVVEKRQEAVQQKAKKSALWGVIGVLGFLAVIALLMSKKTKYNGAHK